MNIGFGHGKVSLTRAARGRPKGSVVNTGWEKGLGDSDVKDSRKEFCFKSGEVGRQLEEVGSRELSLQAGEV